MKAPLSAELSSCSCELS